MTLLSPESTRRFVEVRTTQGDAEQTFRVHCNDCGHGDSVVVLLHGSGPGATGWANFHRNIEPLVAAGHRVLLIDFPGWGQSDPVVCAESRSHFNARIVHGVLQALQIERAHVVGNSMGAHSAVALALEHPEQVDRLVLMGGGTGGQSLFTPMPAEGIKLIRALYAEPTLANLKRMMDVFVFDASSMTDELMQLRLDNMLAQPEHLANFLESGRRCPKQFPDVAHRLGEVKARTLVVWGRDDRFLPMDLGLRLVWGLPDADLVLFSRCGHWAQWEHADKFNRLVGDFLAH
jgi:2-hydroxy-6-oxonona-2,4-dienedioate hydrolase